MTPADAPHLGAESQEALPEQQRRGRIFLTAYGSVLALATLVFLILALFVRDEDLVVHFDAPVARAIQAIDWPPAAWLLTHTSDLGWFPLDVLSVVAVATLLVLLRLRLEAAIVVVFTVLAGQAGTIAKDLVQRARPSSNFVHLSAQLTGFSFPSGHVIFATVLFATTFWIVWIVWGPSWLRNTALAALAVPIVLMGPSRIYLGEHWPTDVLGAYCFGGLWVAAALELILVLKPRLARSWSGRAHRRRWQPLL